MPSHCALVEPLANQKLTEKPFGLGSEGFPLFECLRVLMGLVDIKRKDSKKVIKLRQCFATQRTRRLGAKTLDELVNTIFEDDITTQDFENYLIKGGNDNRAFWEKVKSELCFCVVAEKNGQYLHSFLHLYRVVELISVALPLVYASTEPDYSKALSLIKSLNTEDGGDLAVLRSLASHISYSGNYDELKINFNFPGHDEKWKLEASKQFKKHALENGQVGEIREDNSGFDVAFSKIPSAIVNSRNRMFHRKISGKNFDFDKLDGVDKVCQTLTRPTLYWLSLTIIEIVKVHSARYI